MTFQAFLVACWLVFFGFWILTAGLVKPVAERQRVTRMFRYQGFFWGAGLLLWLDPLAKWNVRLVKIPGLPLAGAAMAALGLAGAIWARVTLGGNWSSAVTIKQGHELVRRGPYRWARNPIYTSLLLMFVGTALAIDRLLALVAVLALCVGVWIKVKQEEEFMLRQFPETYPEYKRQVKALVPYLF